MNRAKLGNRRPVVCKDAKTLANLIEGVADLNKHAEFKQPHKKPWPHDEVWHDDKDLRVCI